MSGIVGMWNLNGKPVERELLGRMSATLAHRGPDGEAMWIEGPVGLACQLLRVTPESEKEIQPLVDSSGNILVFDGRLDNRDGLLANLRDSHQVSSTSPDPALVLAAYQAFGDRFPEKLVGDFALGLFDPTRQQLLLARDSIGIRPLYYCRSRETLFFASEIKALLAHPEVSCQPNDDMLADFLLTQVHDQEMTFFKDIFRVPPSQVAVFSTQGIAKRQYWDFDPGRTIRLKSFEEYAEAFLSVFELAVKRRLRSTHPVAVSVSGGLDSSSILCMAEALARREPGGPLLHGVSYISEEGSPSDEQKFLVEIEKKYGTTIHRVPSDPMGLLDESKDVVRYSETPWLDGLWSTVRSSFRTVKQIGGRVVLTGSWGDHVLFHQAYLIDLFRSLEWRTIGVHLNEHGLWLDDVGPKVFRQRFFLGLLKHHLLRPLYPLIRGIWLNGRIWFKGDRPWFSDTLRRRASGRAWNRPMSEQWESPSMQARSIYSEVRSARHVLGMEINNHLTSMYGLEPAYPFLDRDLVVFLMAIPGEVLTRGGVPKALLRAALRGVLPDAIALRRSKADFTHLVNTAVQRDFPQLVQYLVAGGQAIKQGYISEDVLKKSLERLGDRILGPTCTVAWSLSDLVGLEIWLRVFFAENGNIKDVSAGQNGRHKPVTNSGGGQ